MRSSRAHGWPVRLTSSAAPLVDAASAHRPVAYATGRPGDMYLLHPLTVHAADEHHGSEPRFMAQTPIFLTAPVTPEGSSALALAITQCGGTTLHTL